MNTILTAQTAAAYWRTHDLASTRDANLDNARDAEIRHSALELVPGLVAIDKGSMLHLLVGDPAKKRTLHGIACHRWDGTLPEGSLRQISDRIYLSSPEMCFVQFCSSNSLAHSVQYGMELCGTYALGLNGQEARYDLEPLTNIERLSTYIQGCEGRHGVKTARHALKHILEGAASPLETIVTMLMCMPVRQGGYGLPHPTLNEKIPLDESQAMLAGVECYRGDLSWSDKKLIVEYDSSEFHTGRRKESLDNHRGNMLTLLDRKVIHLSWDMVADLIAFDRTCILLADKLDYRARSRIPNHERMNTRLALRAQIMYPNLHWQL